MSHVSLFDARSFFEKALLHGVQHGIIPPEKIAAMNADAPKGMVQIARYFGSEFLRPELEMAKDRMLNLISLYLEHSTGGDVQKAAESLRDHSLLSRSKGGSDMLKALIAMPDSSGFGNQKMDEDLIAELGRWSLRTLSEYRLVLDERCEFALMRDAALWMAKHFGMDAGDLDEGDPVEAEAVIRTALLLHTLKRTQMPGEVDFEKMVLGLRKNYATAPQKLTIVCPPTLPERFKPTVEAVRQSVVNDLPKLLNNRVTLYKLFDQEKGVFRGRYFWVEYLEFDYFSSKAWDRATGGQQDGDSLLTLFLCVAAGAAPKTQLTTKAATALLRKIRKTGLKPDLVCTYIHNHAPEPHQADYLSLWQNFIEEALPTLESDHLQADAIALLRYECQVTD